jgi:hypothetical protein
VQVRDAFMEVLELKKLGFKPQYDIFNEIINL